MIGFPKWLLAGIVAASVGGAAWVGLVYFLSVEVGYLAWGIGFLAGAGVRWAAGEHDGVLPGAAALIAAVAVVAFSKYMAVSLLVDHEIAVQRAAIAAAGDDAVPDFADRSVALARVADDMILADYPDDPAGADALDWADGVTFDEADRIEVYPPEYRDRAAEAWDALDEAERAEETAAMRAAYDARMDVFRQMEEAQIDAVKQQAFKGAFNFFDLLWFGLAAFTAFGVGSGSVGDD